MFYGRDQGERANRKRSLTEVIIHKKIAGGKIKLIPQASSIKDDLASLTSR